MSNISNVAIVIACYNRPHSLLRLLSSISHSNIPKDHNIDCVFAVDYCSDSTIRQQIKSTIDGFNWKIGIKVAQYHQSRVGLKNNIYFCGSLTSKYSAVIVLEDDLIVSPAFLSYAIACISFFRDEINIGQFSLYSYEYDELSNSRFMPLYIGSDVYFMQWASSRGMIWTRKQWKLFQDWYENPNRPKFTDIRMPDEAKSWPQSSWKKEFLGYLVDTNRYCAYPYFSYSSCYGDQGENCTPSDYPTTQVPLSFNVYPNHFFVEFSRTWVCYDSYFQPTPEYVCKLNPDFSQFEFSVDLNGNKPICSLETPFVLTCRCVRMSVLSFGRNVLPAELNVTVNSNEHFYFLAHTKDLIDKIPLNKSLEINLWLRRMPHSTIQNCFVLFAICAKKLQQHFLLPLKRMLTTFKIG
jgi:hypothetical protein